MKLCRVSNCKNHAHGVICTTHRYRWNTYKSYDLPDYTGIPNYLTDIPLPEGCVVRCKIHGDLTKEQTYVRYHNGKESSWYCKDCVIGINMKNKYKGFSGLISYDSMLKSQNGKCAICKGQNTTKRNGKIKRFAIDHCHETHKIRGLLCAFCNALLGYARDNIEILESAIIYLKSHM